MQAGKGNFPISNVKAELNCMKVIFKSKKIAET